MANAVRVWTSEHFEAGTKYPAARVVDKDGTVCTQSDFSGNVIVRVYDLGSDTPATVVFSNTVSVASSVFNALQNWDIDDDGYNYVTTVTSNNVAGWKGWHTYRVSSLLPHVTQGYIAVVHDLKMRDLLSL